MKLKISWIFTICILLVMISLKGQAQVYVNIRPVAPVITRPVPPGPTHVWIGEEWEPRQGHYVYVGGHWALPPHRGYIWIPGHWRRRGRFGEWWVPGHWGKR